MSDRALMQQALEALEAALSDGKPYIVQSKDAIAALRARLAQPESDPDPSRCPKCGGEADNGHDRCDPPNPYHCTKCMEQPEPEPVAWADKAMELAVDFSVESLRLGSYERKDVYENLGRASWQTIDLQHKREAARERLRQHLYTAPPARQWVDLTDEDKQDLYSNWGVSLAAMHFVSERLKAKNGGTE